MTTRSQMTTTSNPFVLPMVPPNLTGDLHLGHALMACVQDCLVRFHQVQGEKTVYVPGVDHAGIGMYALVRANTYFLPDFPLETRLVEWANHYRQIIPQQFRLLNLACDWEHEVYTMDPRYIKLVYYAFHRLAEGGLLYRGYKVVQWCPNCQTSLSDMECDHVTRDTKVAVMGVRVGKRTELVESSQPELLWSAVALAVSQSPDIATIPSPFGDDALLPIVQWGRPGSKATFLTPAHNADHLTLAKQLGLPIKEALDGQGRSLIPAALGIFRQELREWTISRLGLKTVVKPIEILRCSRCETELIARLSWQWFLRMHSLAQPLEEAIQAGRVRIIPDSQKRQALNWLNHVEDWCISRQIPWGQCIPARICPQCAYWTLDQQPECPECGRALQDEQDVFDTWFSSGHWPLATAGWPDKNEMQGRYPMSTLTTGKDILFFYLIRVQLLNKYLTGEFPAPVSYLHGLVLDAHGAKMSKSKGNTITLSEGVERYGADVLRATLLSACRGSYDIKFRSDLVITQQKVLGVLERLEALASNGLTTNSDTLDHQLLANTSEAEACFTNAINSYHFSTAIEVLETLALGSLARFVSIREREYTHEAECWQGLYTPLLEHLVRLFTPVMSTISSRLRFLIGSQPGDFEIEPSQSTATATLLAAIRELERLRGAIGINTHTTISIVLPHTMIHQLDERWVKYGSLLQFQIGDPLADTIAWRVPGHKDAALYIPIHYAARLCKETQRLLGNESERRRQLIRRVTWAHADTPRAQQVLPALQSALQDVLERVDVLKENLTACKQSKSIE